MQRRKLLQYLPMAFAISASPDVLLDLVTRARNSVFIPADDKEKLLIALVDRILPATSTPSASEAGVPAFMRLALDEIASPQERDSFYAALNQFSDHCLSRRGSAFEALSLSAQDAHLTELFAQRDDFCIQLKILTMSVYFTSQRGMTEALDYNPIPGSYKGCVPVNEATRTEASYF